MIINTSLLTEKLEYIEEAHIVLGEGPVRTGDGYLSGGEDRKDLLAVPAFFNSHTHIGDSFAPDACTGMNVREAVGENGLKWKLYDESTRPERIEAMRASMQYMLSSGTTGFCDFREFGSTGVKELQEAAYGLQVEKIILGRDGAEDCQGLGLNLYQTDQIKKDEFLALHAGELPGEVGKALEYDPDVIIHATSATPDDLREIADRKIPVVICPRANAALGAGFPPVDEMLELGINVCIGTDNVMLNSPDLFRELDFVLKNTRADPKEVLEMACVNPKEVFSLKRKDFMLLCKNSYNLKNSRDIHAAIAGRCDRRDVREVIADGVLL